MHKVALFLLFMSYLLVSSCSPEQEKQQPNESSPEEQLEDFLIGRWELEESFDFGGNNPQIRSMYVFFKGGIVAHGEEIKWNGKTDLPIMEYGNWLVIDKDKIQITFPMKTRILQIVQHPDSTISLNKWDIRGEIPYNPYRYKKID